MSRYGASPIPIPTPATDFYDVVSPALPLGTSEALVICNRTLRAVDPQGFDSVTNSSNWTITPVDPRIAKEDGTFQIPPDEFVATVALPQVAEVFVDDDFPSQYRVVTVTPMENRVRYTFELSSRVRAVGCESLSSSTTASMRALIRGLPPVPRFVQEDLYRDFAMTYFPTDPQQPSSTWRFDTTSDIGIQNNLESLQKRLYRRLSTKPGGFRHLGRGYGIDLKLKTLFRAGRAQELANELARQCKLEPDVVDAGVSVRLQFSGTTPFVEVSIKVVRDDRQTGKFVFPLTLEEG